MTKKPAKKKLRVGILFGGRSGEHEVSLLSAASILKAIDRTKYEVIPIGITKHGQWLTSTEAEHLLTGDTKPAPILPKTEKIKSIELSASADIALQNTALAQQDGFAGGRSDAGLRLFLDRWIRGRGLCGSGRRLRF